MSASGASLLPQRFSIFFQDQLENHNMLLTKRQFLTSVLALSVSAAARAAGGPSGPAVHFQSQGKIGEVFVNHY